MSTQPNLDDSLFVTTGADLRPAELSPLEKGLRAVSGFLCQHLFGVTLFWLSAVFVSFLGYSRQKPLWTDEVIFRWITTLPDLRQILLALDLGLNTDPPLAHFLTHGLTVLFGSAPYVLRFTSMAGLCVMLLCLFLTLRIYIGPLYALLALVLPLCTKLADYGYEARPYGLMYGFFGLAVYCWAKVGEDSPYRYVWNIALGLSLSCALGCHFYSVFALPAFYLGEAVRISRRQRVSWATVGAITGAASTVLLYWPIVLAARQYSSSYFEKPTIWSVPGMLVNSLQLLVIPLFAFLAIVAVFSLFGVRFSPEPEPYRAVCFRELTALALGFLLVPVFGWAAGMIVLKAFTMRYVLHGLFGVFLLVPLFAARAFRLNRCMALALLLACGLLAGLFLGRGTSRLLRVPAPNEDFAQLAEVLPRLSGDIVVSDPHVLIPLLNESPALKAQCLYVWDGEKERTYSGQDVFSHFAGPAAGMGWFRAEPWSQFEKEHSSFLLLTVPDGYSDDIGWVRAYLHDTHRYGNVVAIAGRFLVIEATAKPISAQLSVTRSKP